jgi:hypothetical protein
MFINFSVQFLGSSIITAILESTLLSLDVHLYQEISERFSSEYTSAGNVILGDLDSTR